MMAGRKQANAVKWAATTVCEGVPRRLLLNGMRAKNQHCFFRDPGSSPHIRESPRSSLSFHPIVSRAKYYWVCTHSLAFLSMSCTRGYKHQGLDDGHFTPAEFEWYNTGQGPQEVFTLDSEMKLPFLHRAYLPFAAVHARDETYWRW
jgi:hypothetical protein